MRRNGKFMEMCVYVWLVITGLTVGGLVLSDCTCRISKADMIVIECFRKSQKLDTTITFQEVTQ